MIGWEIKKLQLQNGLVPFDEWFDSLRDQRMQAAVDSRLARVRAGNFGDVKSVRGQQVVVLLGGGEKRTQARDIRRAQQLWQQFTKYASEKLPG